MEQEDKELISLIIRLKAHREPSIDEIHEISLLIDLLYPALLEPILKKVRTDINYNIYFNSLTDSEVRNIVVDASAYQMKMTELGFCYPVNWVVDILQTKKKYKPSKGTMRSINVYFRRLRREQEKRISDATAIVDSIFEIDDAED